MILLENDSVNIEGSLTKKVTFEQWGQEVPGMLPSLHGVMMFRPETYPKNRPCVASLEVRKERHHLRKAQRRMRQRLMMDQVDQVW